MFSKQEYLRFSKKVKILMKEGVNKHLPISFQRLKKKLEASAKSKENIVKQGQPLFMVIKQVVTTSTTHPLIFCDSPLPFSKIKPPKLNKIKQGRFNLRKELFWYLAGDLETAVVEARAPIGLSFTVAQYELSKDLKLIDLANNNDWAIFTKPKDNNWEDHVWCLIQSLCQTSSLANKDVYEACNYFSKIFQSLGFNGLKWRSSMRPGQCYVLFGDFPRKEINTKLCTLLSLEPRLAK